ncbi:MAG TPA: TetR/AcrR family transcriptional regulator [Nitrososphaera sp.]|nr:TetR/AcrR family transcriptional regulator [Nitrososphaera sp.]
MSTPRRNNRTRLIEAAAKMAYRQGFRQTTLADIATEAKIPLGNLYYYFKSKDDIGQAIVDQRLAQLRASCRSWDEAGSPKQRLCACVDTVLENSEALAQGGCPIGTLCTELHKDGGSLAREASVLFAEHLKWIETQFRASGRTKDARSLSVHLLSALQGISVLAHGLNDPNLVVSEAASLKEWINGL